MPITFGPGGLKFLKSPTFDLSSSAFITDEGTSVAFTFTTDGPDGTFYWKTGGTVGAADFTDSTMSGTFITAAGVGNIVRTLRNDLLTEGTETVQLQVLMGSHTGTLLATSSFVDVNDTSLSYYAISASSSTINEGESVTFTITSSGPDETLYWTSSGTTAGADFTDGLTSGTLIVSAGTGSIVRTLKSDLLTEGTEELMLSVRRDSVSGVVLVSSSVSITDTSLTQYAVSSFTDSNNEGGTVTFTFTTTGPDGTFYWTNVGSTNASDFTDTVNSGSFITTAGTGSIVRTLRNDATTEGSETVRVQVRSESFSGAVVALSSAVTINDTSLTPSPSVPWTPANITTPSGLSASYRSNMVWLDPSDTSTLVPVGSLVDGGKISRVSDKSGNNHHAEQNTSAKQPTIVVGGLNGRSVLRFNGLNDGTSITNANSTSAGSFVPTIFAVASKTGAATSFRCIVNIGDYTSPGIYYNNFHAFFGTVGDNFSTFFGNGVSAWNDTNVNTPLTTSTRNNFNILCVTNDYNTKLATPFVNGTAQNAKNGTMSPDGNYSSGYRVGSSAGTTQNFPGDIAEILIIPTALITTDIRLRIEGYLAHKWGLTSKLPANHPYKNSQPMT